MQTYDILMLLVLLATTMFGFWKGMAWQVASLASLVVSYFVARKFAGQLAPSIGNSEPWFNEIVAMLIIYIATSFVIWNLFRLVSGIIDRMKLDSFDHQMGALIGFAKGVLLCLVITFFAVTLLPQSQKSMIIDAQSGQYIVRFLDKAESIIPPRIHQIIHPYVEQIEQGLDPNYQPNAFQNYQTFLPGDNSSAWPTESFAPSNTQPNNQPSVYQPQPVQPNNGWPTSQPSEQPAWPTEPHTADRPGNAAPL